MTVESLATGDQVVVLTEITTVGSTGVAVQGTPTAGATLDCLVQTPSAREITKYAARGMSLSHQVFFPTDPGLDTGKLLKWTVQAGVTLGTVKYLRVLDVMSEGPPGEDWLWAAGVNEETIRKEP